MSFLVGAARNIARVPYAAWDFVRDKIGLKPAPPPPPAPPPTLVERIALTSLQEEVENRNKLDSTPISSFSWSGSLVKEGTIIGSDISCIFRNCLRFVVELECFIRKEAFIGSLGKISSLGTAAVGLIHIKENLRDIVVDGGILPACDFMSNLSISLSSGFWAIEEFGYFPFVSLSQKSLSYISSSVNPLFLASSSIASGASFFRLNKLLSFYSLLNNKLASGNDEQVADQLMSFFKEELLVTEQEKVNIENFVNRTYDFAVNKEGSYAFKPTKQDILKLAQEKKRSIENHLKKIQNEKISYFKKSCVGNGSDKIIALVLELVEGQGNDFSTDNLDQVTIDQIKDILAEVYSDNLKSILLESANVIINLAGVILSLSLMLIPTANAMIIFGFILSGLFAILIDAGNSPKTQKAVLDSLKYVHGIFITNKAYFQIDNA